MTFLLFPRAAPGTSRGVSTDPEIFDRALWRRRRDRALPRFAEHDFLFERMAADIEDRLDFVSRSFTRALDLGTADGRLAARLRARGIPTIACDPGFAAARAAGGVQCDADRLPFADGSFDLIVSVGLLDGINDLPGALTLARRALKPDGLFLAAFCGAGTLGTLRSGLLSGDGGPAAARIHPQIDVRAAGDLLSRAGFAMPVTDTDRVTVRYSSPLALMHDLRGMAATNRLRDRAPSLSRTDLAALFAYAANAADADGKIAERFDIVHLSGWAPAESQPKPARRGSGRVSLADALKPKPSE
ncbi:class I SAM-dependent methyltransferase [Sphingomonas zeicaulis]|uniref:class I SAM-dependent methyltransferase n=1 Tax=Sphingomonas zeicaulis TaxID=1632740 RepID=UPI003D258C64